MLTFLVCMPLRFLGEGKAQEMRIKRLIRELDSEEYQIRERTLGEAILAPLEKALRTSAGLELKGRARRIIREIRFKGRSIVCGLQATISKQIWTLSFP